MKNLKYVGASGTVTPINATYSSLRTIPLEQLPSSALELRPQRRQPRYPPFKDQAESVKYTTIKQLLNY